MVASRIYKTLLQTQEGINYLNIGLMVLCFILIEYDARISGVPIESFYVYWNRKRVI